MARRTGRTQPDQNSTDSPNNQEEAVVTATDEAVATAEESSVPSTDEAVELTPEDGDKAEKPAKEKVEIDLTEFKAAVEAGLVEKDDTTGELPVASIESIKAVYNGLKGGVRAKNAATKYVGSLMGDAMNSGDLSTARAYFQVSDQALVSVTASRSTSGGGGGTPKEPTDPTEAFVQRVAIARLAYGLITSHVPDGVKEDWAEQVEAQVNANYQLAQDWIAWGKTDPETRGEEPELTPFVKAALKASQGKSSKSASAPRAAYTGERRDVAKHITEAFAGKEAGTFMKINEIRQIETSEYKANEASAGAISARLFPASGESALLKLGIRPETQDGKKGAVLVNPDNSPVEA